MRFFLNWLGAAKHDALREAERTFRRNVGKNKVASRKSIQQARIMIEQSQRTVTVAEEAIKIIRGES